MEVAGRSARWGIGPAGHGPAGWKLRARPRKSTACGQAAAKAMRTLVAVSMTRPATLSRCSLRVVNSAPANSCGLGMRSRRVRSSQ